MSPDQLKIFMFSAFAGSALLLAIVGMPGVMAYSVAQRVHEIGVRLALGARRINVARMIVPLTAQRSPTDWHRRWRNRRAHAGAADRKACCTNVQPTEPWTFSVVTAALAVTSLVC